MSTTIWTAISLIGCGWLLIVAREIRDLLQPAESNTEESQ